MRIQHFSEITGLPKRTIHFYIKEKLLFPKTDAQNGYYDFTEEDIKRLMLIKKLRDMGLSISVIRALFNNPTAAAYYLRRRIGEIEQDIHQLKNTTENISFILKELPITPTFMDLCSSILRSEVNTDIIPMQQYDGELVNHFLWKTFWPKDTLSEFQQFLWDKINRLTDTRTKNPYYANVYDYLCSQNQKKIDALYAERNTHFGRIAELPDSEIPQYAEEMKHSVTEFIHTPMAVKQWKEHYHSFLAPQMHIFTGEIGNLAKEMSPFFAAYQKNSSKACILVYEWLTSEDGQDLYCEITRTLKGYVNLEDFHHAELESMNTIFKY